jgi:glycosyltransferase involved in cell wall biosynthesis
MNIVGIFLNNEMRTGANRRYLELMEALADKGHNVVVLMNSYLDFTPTRFSQVSIPVRYRRRGFPPTSFIFKRAIADNLPFIRAELARYGIAQVDWIHIHGDMHFSSALYLKKKTGARLFFAFRCNDITRAHILRKQKAYTVKEHILSYPLELKDRLRERKISRKADLITFQNAPDRDIFLKRIGDSQPGAQTVIIPGNIGLPRFRKETENKNHSVAVTKLVYVGSTSLSKGLQHLLEALAALKEKGYRGLRLHVLGKISADAKALVLVNKLDIAEMVSFEGYVSPFSFLEKCDLMVYPTLYDAFPDTILEALHTGCPVLASKTGGVVELLQYPELLFDIGQVDEIVERIERCITDATFYRAVRDRCTERSSHFRFDWAERFESAMRDNG